MSSEKILIVEDSPTSMLQITTILQKRGYDLMYAVDGEEALQKAVAYVPNLIVLDVILPKKNGFQVCRQLKNTPGMQGIKILMLTSKTQQSDRFWGLKQGADDYMTKPFEANDLLKKVNELLQ
ncbi:MAG: chemotaxis protein CheY [Desulfatitalea sp. BRH_c12]|nr:MAG: chemotaxis protein CheY [Desulfatitalea sp. BRH_c12]